MDADDGRRRRLAIILAVAGVISIAGLAYRAVSDRIVDDDAADVAERVFAALDRYDAQAMDDLLTEELLDAWSGASSTALRVDGHDPAFVGEPEGELVVRYRVERWGATRCVDARWPDGGQLRVDVTDC